MRFSSRGGWAGRIVVAALVAALVSVAGAQTVTAPYPASGLVAGGTTVYGPLPGSTPLKFTAVAGGVATGYALGTDGRVYAAGSNGGCTSTTSCTSLTGVGALGNGSTAASSSATWSPVLTAASTPLSNIVQIAATAASGAAYALDNTGTVWAWGGNANGTLGVGSATPTASGYAVAISGLPGPATQIAAGAQAAYALLNTGAIYAWGINGNGQTCQASSRTSPSRAPLLVSLPGPATTVATYVAGGGGGLYALLTGTSIPSIESYNSYLNSHPVSGSGIAASCGLNSYKQLGNGGTAPATDTGYVTLVANSPVATPTAVTASGVTPLASLAAGTYTIYGVDFNGNPVAWGGGGNVNGSGTGANGTTGVMNYMNPLTVSAANPLPAGVTIAKAAAGGLGVGYFLDTNGNAYTIGAGITGNLGNGVTTQTAGNTTLTKVSQGAIPTGVGLTAIAPIGAGFTSNAQESVLALGTDGNLYGWGSNNNGQLGLPATTTPYTTPVAIPAPAAAVTSVSFGPVASGTPGTGLTTNATLTDGTTGWSVASPAGTCGATVDVNVAYTVAGLAETPITYAQAFTYGAPPSITTQPVSGAVVSGNTFTTSVAVSGDTTPTVQWQSSPDGATWANISGATGLTLSVSPTVTTQYRAVASNCWPSAATSNAITVTVTPQAPAITSPANNALTTSTALTISGTAQANASAVAVTLDGATYSATLDGSGGWTLSATLAIGAHAVSATQTVGGETSAASATVSFAVIPLAPTVSAPANGTNTTPEITGTATANATVTVTLDGTTHTVTATAGGTWTYTPTAALAVGSHTVSATQTVNNETSAASASASFAVLPGAPTITAPTNGATLVASATGTTITGTAQSGASVAVSVDGGTALSATVSGTGWTVTTPTALAAGTHTVSATQTVNSQTSAASATINFTVTPAAPTITAPANNSTLAATATATTISGTAQANAAVAVTLTQGGTPVALVNGGSVTADGSGAWSVATTAALADGAYSVSVTQTVSSQTSTAATSAFTVAAVPSAPVISSPANGASLVVSATATTISGTAQDGASVSVTVDGGAPLTTTASGTGAWSVTTTAALTVGSHTISATQTVSTISSTAATTTFSVIPVAPTVTAPANGSSTTSTKPTFTGAAQAGATVTITVTQGGTTVATGTATGAAWSWTPTTALAIGAYSVSATQTVNSQTSTASTAVAFNVIPMAPTIAAPANNSTLAATATATTISGTAQANASVTVTLTQGGTPVTLASGGNVTANASGAWSVATTAALADGAYSVSVTQTINSQTSAAATSAFTVAAVPGAPVISSPANGASLVVSTTATTISGTAQSGASVSVTVDGGTPLTTTASGAGAWSVTTAAALTVGSHTISATQTVNTIASAAATVTFGVTPVALAITQAGGSAVSDGGSVTIVDTAQTISGNGAQAGATVTVTVTPTGATPNATPSATGSVTLSGSGAWTVASLTPTLADGQYSVSITQTVNGQTSAPVAFTLDVIPPPPPITKLDAQPATSGMTTTNTTPTFAGTAKPGATVTLTLDDPVVYTTTADVATGAWSVPLTPALASGNHHVFVTQTVNEETSGQSPTLQFILLGTDLPASTSAVPALHDARLLALLALLLGGMAAWRHRRARR